MEKFLPSSKRNFLETSTWLERNAAAMQKLLPVTFSGKEYAVGGLI
jgi:hypothetical protein